MHKVAGALFVIVITISMYGTDTRAEEKVALLRDAYRTVVSSACSHRSPSPIGPRACEFPTIVNEVWATKPGDLTVVLNPQQLRDQYTFTVYTKKDIDDDVIAPIKADIINLKSSLAHNAQVLEDVKGLILHRLDQLPAELPTDVKFYQQIRERLKADIVADFDKTKADAPQ
jgi:hypothetical protein